MGFSSEHRGRGPKVFVPGTGQFLNSTCIRTNQSSEGIRYRLGSLTIVSGSARGNYIGVTNALFNLGWIDLSAAFVSTDHSQIVKRIAF